MSDAVTMMHGNLYYAYNNYSYGTGGVFLMIPFLFVYELFAPQFRGRIPLLENMLSAFLLCSADIWLQNPD